MIILFLSKCSSSRLHASSLISTALIFIFGNKDFKATIFMPIFAPNSIQLLIPLVLSKALQKNLNY